MSTAEQAAPRSTRSVVEDFYAAIFAGDDNALRECLHDDAELHQPPNLPYGGIYRGSDEMIPLWRDVILPLADPDSSGIDTFVVDGDTAIVIANSKTAGTGKPITACEEYKFRDGKIARIRMFWYDPNPVIEATTDAGTS